MVRAVEGIADGKRKTRRGRRKKTNKQWIANINAWTYITTMAKAKQMVIVHVRWQGAMSQCDT